MTKSANKPELPKGMQPSIQSMGTNTPVPQSVTPSGEQVAGGVPIERARYNALGAGDFHGETDLLNFDEKLRDYDPGEYGELLRATKTPGRMGGGGASPLASSRDERIDRPSSANPTVGPQRLQRRRFREASSPLALALASPMVSTEDIINKGGGAYPAKVYPGGHLLGKR